MRRPVLAALLAALALAAPAAAQRPVPDAWPRDSIRARIADLRRIHTPEGIEELDSLQVNGSTQWVSIRGLNRSNPVLVFLHGGPGTAMLGMTWSYQKPWEDFFTVVNYDQRGVGKSFRAADSARLARTLSRDLLVDDAVAVVHHVRRKLGKEKVFVMGFSYGSDIGTHLAARHPELVHAYVGVGQVSGRVAGRDNEERLYAELVRRARAANDTQGVRALEAMAPYPAPAGPTPARAMLTARALARRHDGGWYGKPTFDLFNALNEWAPEYTADDVRSWGASNGWMVRHIVDGRSADSTRTLPRDFRVPVFLFHGRYDLHTTYDGARAYFETVRAPRKEFVTFERSSHMVMWEEPGRFLQTMLAELLPLAERPVPFRPLLP
jgi:pimeloyl-ACP methyl ester carboxylesterase